MVLDSKLGSVEAAAFPFYPEVEMITADIIGTEEEEFKGRGKFLPSVFNEILAFQLVTACS